MHSTKIALPDYPDALPDLIRLAAAPDNSNGESAIPAAVLVYEDNAAGWFQLGTTAFEVRGRPPRDLLGDVVLANRARGTGDRILRHGSCHNTLLITERCDQLCVMCSQPPKDYELDLFDAYRRALPYAAPDAIIGISGGEPLLYKSAVFTLIAEAAATRPDLGFHVLTNAQHLEDCDHGALAALPHDRLRFAVPLYAAEAVLHDAIVGKPGAFERALEGIAMLLEAGAEVEVRTVLMQHNAAGLADLARFLAWTLPDLNHWALMQMEYIGYARRDWSTLFFDHSLDPVPIEAAVKTAEQHGLRTVLYNMPLCTLPPHLRDRAPRTISDWKQKYLPSCNACACRTACSGLFAWQDPVTTFDRLEPICDAS
ncbi:MAG: His-Xaa-Ser system radical SAM maturase HxsC [Pseudomonadota bacterium]